MSESRGTLAPRCFIAGTILCVLGLWAAPARTAAPVAVGVLTAAAAEQATPMPQQDDARLNAVQFVGRQNGWAVGERGVIWQTVDGGRTWQIVSSPVHCGLRAISFLTDRVGWIVGGGDVGYTRLGYGVVLATRDAGRTWTLLGRDVLPPLFAVRFFDGQTGIVAGEATAEFPTGLATTRDGGKTWQSMPGPKQSGWRCADFVAPAVGVVGGQRGRVSLVGGNQLLVPRLAPLGLRGVWGVTIDRNETGWLVGDGGLVLQSGSGGVVWKSPPTALPVDLRDMTDFRAVASRGKRAWLAGDPGGVIWYTPDGGRTWLKQYTGQTVPIRALAFPAETDGWAVGDLGMILHTADGGRTWKAVHGAGRRAAIMLIHARPQRVSFRLLAKESGELGYRSVVVLPARRDVGPDGHISRNQDRSVQDAVTAVGGSAGEIDWRFPIDVPDIEKNSSRLIADWNRRTEGRFGRVFLGKLVCWLRTWRPSVVVIDQPSADDATANLLVEAVTRAVRQAADPTRFLSHQELASLKPWRVEKLYLRLPSGSAGETLIDPHEYLPRSGTTVQTAAAKAEAMLSGISLETARADSYRAIFDRTRQGRESVRSHGFFVGLGIAAGSAARRRLMPIDETHRAEREAVARRQRNFQAFAERYLERPREAAQLIAQLRNVTSGMQDEQAAVQLVQLASDYRRHSQQDLAVEAWVELVTRYPRQPAAAEAMRQLFQMWIGQEPAYQRVRRMTTEQREVKSDPSHLQDRIEKAFRISHIDPRKRTASTLDLGPDPLTLVSHEGKLHFGDNRDWRTGTVRNWHEQALRMAGLIRRVSPELYRSPDIRFPLASLLRQRGRLRLAGDLYRRYQQSGDDDPWKKTAVGELWISHPTSLPPKPLLPCRRTAKPPYLDGVLSDDCWKDADEIRLTAEGKAGRNNNGRSAIVFMSYDAKYLYLAASVPRVAEMPADRPNTTHRRHDADLSSFDRLSLFLDVDRDYTTYYTLSVDQRGWTAESCHGDVSWNPKWYVAATGDAERWRIEIAIPMTELVPVSPVKKNVWAIGIIRTLPAVGLQSWTHPAGSRPRPETFGLLRFD